MKLIASARLMYADKPLGFDLDHRLYALDSSTIDLYLALFPWSNKFSAGKGAVKMHMLLDLDGIITSIIQLTACKDRESGSR